MKKRSSGKRRAPKLGQHFLTGTWAARALARAANISANEIVLEIGPGTGILTRELLKTGARVIAIEKDARLVAKFKETFAHEIESKRLVLAEDDIRNFDPKKFDLESGQYTLAANIPYYITGEIMRMFLSAEVPPRTIALLIQKEVAERIIARDRKESILSLSVKAYGLPKIVAKVSRGNFSPPPAVDSSIILISDVSKQFFHELDERFFFRLVRAGFSSKRKLLAGNLANIVPKSAVADAFVHCAIPMKARAEDVPLEQWKCLAQRLTIVRS